MSHWYTADQLAAGRRSDLEREAAGGIRMRAAGHGAAEPGRRNLGARWLRGGRQLAGLRSGMALIVGEGWHAFRLRLSNR